MSTFINIRTTRHGCWKESGSLLDLLKKKPRFGKWANRGKWKRRRITPKQRIKDDFFGRSKPLFNMALRMMAEQAKKKPPRCHPYEHEFTQNGDDSDYCIKCGMSVIAHAFLEAP